MTPKAAVPFIKRMHKSRQPTIMLGPPGIGKSDLFQQAARELNIKFIDFRLIYFDPVDLRGIPMPDVAAGTTRWLTPDFFPKDGEGILLMEEITSAPTSVQASAYQLTHDRRLGEYVLPDGWTVMGAGNRQSDRAVANRMPSALVSRCNMQTLDVSQKDFEDFAITTGRIIPEVIAFLRYRPQCLMNFDPTKWKDNEPFACPRTWEYLSRDMKNNNNEITHEIITGFIGKGASAEFYGFLDVYKKIPSIDEIISKPLTTMVPKDPAPLYAIATALARHATPKNGEAIFAYLNRMPNEFEMCSVKDMASRNIDMTNVKAFNTWLIKHGHLFA